LFEKRTLRIFLDEALQPGRIGLPAVSGVLSELELSGLSIGNGRVDIVEGVGPLFPLRVQGDDLLVELLGFGR
jgi:hypothetical protein